MPRSSSSPSLTTKINELQLLKHGILREFACLRRTNPNESPSTKRPGNDYDGEGSLEGGNFGMAHVSARTVGYFLTGSCMR